MSANGRIRPDALAHAETRSAPPGELIPESYAARLYSMLAPLAQWDEATGWSLLILCNAIGVMFQLVEEIVRDGAGGPGWSLLLDLERCPDIALPWLAQLVGVRLLPGSTPAEQRERIASTDGFRRGTPAAMRGAVLPTLTGLRRLDLRERTGGDIPEGHSYGYVEATYADYTALSGAYADYLHLGGSPDAAYYVTARTYTAETPDPAATLRALLSQKPAGLVLDYDHVPGQTYAYLAAHRADYAAVAAAYPDYLAVKLDEP